MLVSKNLNFLSKTMEERFSGEASPLHYEKGSSKRRKEDRFHVEGRRKISKGKQKKGGDPLTRKEKVPTARILLPN